MLGGALCRIFKFLGYNTVGINHLGDYGTQFGKLISAYKRWGDKETIEKGGIRALNELYVKFHQEAEDVVYDLIHAEPVDAIPIEDLKKLMKKCATSWSFGELIDEIIKLWRKENESKK